MTEIEMRILDNQIAIMDVLKNLVPKNDADILDLCSSTTAEMLEKYFYGIDSALEMELPS